MLSEGGIVEVNFPDFDGGVFLRNFLPENKRVGLPLNFAARAEVWGRRLLEYYAGAELSIAQAPSEELVEWQFDLRLDAKPGHQFVARKPVDAFL
jgi:hypothetical protein